MSTEALPALEGVANFRELGGLPTADGRRVRSRRIFRSGHWGNATEQDQELMRALGIGIVFDFRSERDLAHEPPDQLPAGTELVRLPMGDPAGGPDIRKLFLSGDRAGLEAAFGEGRAAETMRRGAAHLVTGHTGPYGRFLSALAEPDSPAVLFHCSAGKDRAGWAASLVLLALGVPEPEVVDHYLESNQHFEVATKPPGDPLSELMRPLVRVEPDYVRASLDAVRDHFGGLDGYLDALGLPSSGRSRLAKNWLQSRPG